MNSAPVSSQTSRPSTSSAKNNTGAIVGGVLGGVVLVVLAAVVLFLRRRKAAEALVEDHRHSYLPAPVPFQHGPQPPPPQSKSPISSITVNPWTSQGSYNTTPPAAAPVDQPTGTVGGGPRSIIRNTFVPATEISEKATYSGHSEGLPSYTP